MGGSADRRHAVRIALAATAAAALLGWGATPALAAKPSGKKGGGGGSSTPTGNDISYPQCGGSFPVGSAFGIVGLTGGLADDLNPCFGPSTTYPSYTQSELYWAVASTVGGAGQPRASLYVNTADPGNVYNGTVISDWPTSGGNATYGDCTTTTVTLTSGTYTVGENSDACAWQYGYNMASKDAAWLTAAAAAINNQDASAQVSGWAGSYPWWLDVETANTWQAKTTMNVADLQGMIAALTAAGASTVGAYSTAYQWDKITGGTTSASASGSLYGIPDWIPGARTLSGAQSNCTQASFTVGTVALTQWFSHPFDGDYACAA